MNRIELSKNINKEDLLKLSLWKIIWFNWIITFEKGKMGDKFFFKNNFPNWGGNIFLGKNIDLYWVLANGNRLPENDLRKVYMAWCLHCWTEEWLRPFGSWIFRWRCCQCQLLTQMVLVTNDQSQLQDEAQLQHQNLVSWTAFLTASLSETSTTNTMASPPESSTSFFVSC